MNLNRISVGGGLAVLGCSIFALAGAMVVSSGGNPAQAGSPMFAGDRKGEAVPQVPSMLEGEPARGVDGGAGMAAGTASCWEEGESLHWFAEPRAIEPCLYLAILEGGFLASAEYRIDVDGQGQGEFIGYFGAGMVIAGGLPVRDDCVLALRRGSIDGGAIVVIRDCLLSTSLLLQFADTQFPNAQNVGLGNLLWYDIDGDFDLDLVGSMAADSVPPQGSYFLLENIGFEYTQGLTGDLDGNNAVDATDLAMLLGGWTGG